MLEYRFERPKTDIDITDLAHRVSRAVGARLAVGLGHELIIYSPRELTATELAQVEQEIALGPPPDAASIGAEYLSFSDIIAALESAGLVVRYTGRGLMIGKTAKSRLLTAIRQAASLLA